jgi:stage III sporulation protein AE
MRITLLLLIIVLSFSPLASAGTPDQAPSLDIILQEQLNELDLSPLEDIVAAIRAEYDGYLPSLDLSYFRTLREGGGFRPGDVLAGLLRYAARELAAQTTLLAKLIVLAVLCTLVKRMQDSLGGSVGEIAYAICYLVLIGIALQSFSHALGSVSASVHTMVSFIYSLLPVLLTLLMSMGAAGSAALFHPMITVAVTVVSTIVANTVLPLLYFSGVLYLINSLSDKLPVSKLAGLLRDIAIVVMGFSFTVFVGLSIAQGTAAGVADGVAVRTAKFTAKTFIPVVGGLFSDVFETVAGCSALLKNGVGLVGLISILLLCALPAVKIMAVVLVYRLAAAIVQPMGATPVSEALSSLGSILTVVSGALITVGVMLFILITIVVGSGNAALSLR